MSVINLRVIPTNWFSPDHLYVKCKSVPNMNVKIILNICFSINKDKRKVVLSDLKVDFLPDRGLIIGTDEYKKKIDELVFNDLVQKGICFIEWGELIEDILPKTYLLDYFLTQQS